MTFIIPKGGKTLHAGKRLVSLAEGEYSTTDKVLIEALKGAQGVTEKQTKKQTKAPE